MGESLEFDGKTYPIHPLPDNLMDIINAGGLVKAMQKRNNLTWSYFRKASIFFDNFFN